MPPLEITAEELESAEKVLAPDVLAAKPFPNEHACRILPPGDFQEDSFRRITRGDDPPVAIIIGRLEGEEATTTQAFRYPIDDWTEDAAESHCDENEGTFEAAAEEEKAEIEPGEADAGEEPNAGDADPAGAGEDTLGVDPKAEFSHNELWEMLSRTMHDEAVLPQPTYESGGWVVDVFDDYVVYELGDKLWRRDYLVDDEGQLTMGDPVEVVKQTEYVAVAEPKAVLTGIKAHPSGKWGRFHGFAAPYGGPFKTEEGGRDLDNEAFDESTDFCLNWYEKRPILYHHGMDKDVDAEVVGEEVSHERLPAGLWLEGQLEKGAQYAEAIWQMVLDGRAFFSTQALPLLVKKLANGLIKRWPVAEWTITPTPSNLLAFVTPAQAEKHFKAAGIEWKDPPEGLQAPGEEHTTEGNEMPIELTAEQKKELYADFKAQAATEAEEERIAQEAKAAEIKVIEEAAVAKAMENAKRKFAESKELPFEFETGGEGDDEPTVPEHIQRYAVLSPYDRLGVLDLAVRVFINGKKARMGDPINQGEALKAYRALAVKAHKFIGQEDTVAKFDRYGELHALKVPAFDPSILAPWKGRDEGDTVRVKGFGNVPVADNVTPGGVRAALKIGAAKSNELVYSTQQYYGDEWVPTLMAAALWRSIRMEARVLTLFDNFPMPSQPYAWPGEGMDPTIFKGSETLDQSDLAITALTNYDSKIGTDQTVFTAGKMVALSFWSEEMREDSIIAPDPQFRDQYGLAFAHGIDYVLINGDESNDSANISYDGAAIDDYSKILIIDGLRLKAITTFSNTRDAGALTVEDVNATRKLMGTNGVYGADVNQLVLICDVPTSFMFEDLGEVLTRDKYGDAATILRGYLANIKGIPIIQSPDYPLTASNGKIHYSTGNTLGSFLLVNRLGVKIGWRRRPRIIVGQIPFSDAWYIVGFARFDLGCISQSAASPPDVVALSYNITV